MKLYFGNAVTAATTLMLLALLGFVGYSSYDRDNIQYWGRRSALLLTLFHFPCGTTCLTIWRETRSLKWTALAIALPTAAGILCCLLVRLVCGVFL